MRRWDCVIDLISIWSGRISAYLLIPGTLVLVYEVTMRYLFQAPTIWAHGVSQRIFAVYLMIGAAYVLQQKGHIRMDMLYNRFSPRIQAIVDLMASPLIFIIVFTLLWFGSNFFLRSFTIMEVDETPLHGAVWPVKFFVPVTGFLLLLQAVVDFYRSFKTAILRRRQ